MLFVRSFLRACDTLLQTLSFGFIVFFPSTHTNLCLLSSLARVPWKNSQSWIFCWYVSDSVCCLFVCLLFWYEENDYQTGHNAGYFTLILHNPLCLFLLKSFGARFCSKSVNISPRSAPVNACLFDLVYERIPTVFRCKWKSRVLMCWGLKNSLGKTVFGVAQHLCNTKLLLLNTGTQCGIVTRLMIKHNM